MTSVTGVRDLKIKGIMSDRYIYHFSIAQQMYEILRGVVPLTIEVYS